MNRIIIIGNGFDLAHGLETSYNHFIVDYLKTAFSKLKESRFYEDELLKVERNYNFDNNSWFRDENRSFELYKLAHSYDIKFTFKSILWKQIITTDQAINWVDLEMTYYNYLKNLLKPNHKSLVKKLNLDLSIIKKFLIQYLIKATDNIEIHESLWSQYIKQMGYNFNQLKGNTKNNQIQEYYQLFVINFNYTNTIDKYREALSRYNANLINIHGKLEIPDSIIFGFGDELDKQYQEIEDLNDNDYFEHIKSFSYLNKRDYRDIFTLLESDNEPFEVLIFGHSLGISDRTMFSQIFNNPNLRKVQIFYHEKEDGTNDFRTKTHEISRHFKDKGKMRKQILPFNESQPMAQFNDQKTRDSLIPSIL